MAAGNEDAAVVGTAKAPGPGNEDVGSQLRKRYDENTGGLVWDYEHNRKVLIPYDNGISEVPLGQLIKDAHNKSPSGQQLTWSEEFYNDLRLQVLENKRVFRLLRIARAQISTHAFNAAFALCENEGQQAILLKLKGEFIESFRNPIFMEYDFDDFLAHWDARARAVS